MGGNLVGIVVDEVADLVSAASPESAPIVSYKFLRAAGDTGWVFHLPEVPDAAFDEEGEQPERALIYPAIVVAKLNRNEWELALGHAFPYLPISRAGPCAIHLNWGEALMRAALEWLFDQRHRELKQHLGRGT